MKQELPYEEIPYDTPLSKLSPLQAKVALALAHGGTLTEVANSCGIHRVTIYRWMKTFRVFETAVEQERAEYALLLRDDLRELSERALRTLSAILDDQLASPSTKARVGMFIMQRNDSLKRGWALPVNMAPLADRDMEPDSPLIAEDERRIRELEAQMAAESKPPAEPAPAPEPAPAASDATPCNGMQHDAANFEPDPAPSPLPPAAQRPVAAEPANATPCNGMQHDAANFQPGPAPRPTAAKPPDATPCNQMQRDAGNFTPLPPGPHLQPGSAPPSRGTVGPASPQCYPDI